MYLNQNNDLDTLSAKNLKKSYKGKNVIEDVSISVRVGEIVGLLGPNGSGKTTSFYMIVGLIKPDAGIVMIGNNDISKLPMHKRSTMGIGYLPQDMSIFRQLSVSENIMAVLQVKKISRSAQKRILNELLEEFHIGHIRDSLGRSLSGGERRRVEIARALAMDPKFLLLDEPFAGVDPISVEDMQNVIVYLKNRVGILITDHNVRETLNVCSRAYILSNGKILAEGKPEEIYKNEQVKKVYLGKNFS